MVMNGMCITLNLQKKNRLFGGIIMAKKRKYTHRKGRGIPVLHRSAIDNMDHVLSPRAGPYKRKKKVKRMKSYVRLSVLMLLSFQKLCLALI